MAHCIIDDGETKITQAFDLLHKAQNIPKVEEDYVVVPLGNTGAGKTALVKTAFDDLTKLKSIQDEIQGNIIIDTDEKIKEGAESATFIPDIFIYNGVAYCDTPGFKDTRSSNFDMIGNYIIKKLVTDSKYVKFLCVFKAQGFEVRQEIMDFFRSITSFINNIKEYENSLTLIITKVSNDSNATKVSVVRKLEKFYKDINENPKQYSESFYTQVLLLLHIFLKNIDGDYPNIGLFIQPKEIGTLDSFIEIKNNRNKLRDIINKSGFSIVNPDHFSVSISSDSLIDINVMIKLVSNKIKETIENQSVEFNDFLKCLIENADDEVQLNKTLKELIVYFKRNLSELTNSHLNNLTTHFQYLLRKFNIENKTVIRVLEFYLPYVNLIQEMYKECDKLNTENWIKILKNVLQNFELELAWSSFKLNIPDFLSKIENYKSLQKLDKITHENLKFFFGSLETSSLKITNSNIDELNVMLTMMKIQTTNFYESTGTLIIKSDFVTMSDLNRILNKEYGIPVCEAYVYALDTIFVDENFEKIGGKFKLVLISPNLVIIDKKVIKLDGFDGNPLEEEYASIGEKGMEGRAGGAGGCFYGLFNNVSESGYLEISANGGNGSKGQNGGNGKDGKDGILSLDEIPMEKPSSSLYLGNILGLPQLLDNIRNEDFSENASGEDKDNTCSQSSLENIREEDSSENASGKEDDSNHSTPVVINKEIESVKVAENIVDNIRGIFGLHKIRTTQRVTCLAEGEKGGDGCPGGPGGLGGNKGIITIFMQSRNIVTECRDGNKGPPGLHGKGGKGGKNMSAQKVYEIQDATYHFLKEVLRDVEHFVDCGFADSGKDFEGTVMPNKKTREKSVKNVDIKQAIQNYIAYLEENMNNRYRKDKLRRMLSFVSDK